MTAELTLAAVDLGASSGRVMAARVGRDRLDLHEVHRFPNRPVRTAGALHWDVLAVRTGRLGNRCASCRSSRSGATRATITRPLDAPRSTAANV